ncbi:glycoside hydrolase family 140 protein [Pedobacter sp. MC2016-14]|uniref:glycoside hydrolase family 140 protein n=1 Tax=Pedobacter sp. MC2016-14 TaxID=2897327 RepID=UPI001E5FD8C9|nr:glycoside hydrolase family 140 protein [Pedobacter sp. MC2016-14]MCD0489348.1 glycoside hydrolase family 140 protein [Pedobacter sp. MC2016-14]
MYNRILLFVIISMAILSCTAKKEVSGLQDLKVSANGRYLMTADGEPFFWLGDTGWLLFNKTTREEANQYLEDRKNKGFNVIQVMVLHTVPSVNVYGDSSIRNSDVSMPDTTKGSLYSDSVQYDFWDHVDYIVDKAAEKGLYMAMVPVWGTNVKDGKVSPAQAEKYAVFLAERYKNRKNIIWLNGGDIRGTEGMEVWNTIGSTIKKNDPGHLMTFHPRGRTSSTDWFHNSSWLDFNMAQSGHRRYDQDTTAKEKWHHGEDNWKFIEADYKLTPVKPAIDGEPSYEGIPQGLHDTTEVRWNDNDVRRYGYWSVFAGGFGYTYGDNAVMQMYHKGDKKSSYGPKETWDVALNAKGAGQMIHLKTLMLSRPYFERVPDQSIIAGTNGEKYNRLIATRGKDYLFIYTYTGRNISLNMGKIEGEKVKASWFNPRDGKITAAGEIDNKGTHDFDPPGTEQNGNDWVLILDKI